MEEIQEVVPSHSGNAEPIFGGGFYFIATPLSIDFSLPYPITPTLQLEKASDKQVEAIHSVLVENHGITSITHRKFYECDIIREALDNGVTYSFTPLPTVSWRYHTISYKGNGLEVHRFLQIADLIYPNISSFEHWVTSEAFGRGNFNGYGRDGFGKTNYYFGLTPEIKVLSVETLDAIKDLLGKYLALDKTKHEGIIRAIDINSNLIKIRENDSLMVLALFMIIEMLLTHNPGDKEIGDSLTHQIKSKIAFLSPRLKEPFDYSAFNSVTDHKKIWGCLYAYRSRIAHGNHLDFNDPDLRPLKDEKTALDFLRNATRKILAHALSEPDLINGLKPI